MKIAKGLLSLATLGFGVAVSTVTNADIGGTVFRDLAVSGATLNTYGVKDTNELGVAGITVTAFDSSGSVVGTPATTTANGSWAIVGTSGDVRVEFSGIPSYLESSPANTGSNTTVQFVVDGATSVDLGLHEPADYTSTAVPEVILSSWVGDTAASGGSAPTTYSFPFDRNGQNEDDTFYDDTTRPIKPTKVPAPTTDATASQVGATWGLAYQKNQQRYFSAAGLRRHAGLAAGTGTIFVIDKSAASAALSHQFNLNGVVTASGGTIDLGSICRGGACKDDTGNTGIEEDYAISGQQSVDLDGAKKVGKIAFGDIDMEPQTNNLWAVNLNQKALIKIDVGADDATTLPISVDQYLISGLANVPSCNNGEIRPWGLNFSQGKGYLGLACDAENGGTTADLIGYVVSFDPNDVASGFTSEVSFPLGFARNTDARYNFAPWSHNWSDFRLMFGSRYTLPQAIVSDIEFDKAGNMNIALSDRAGMQLGTANYKPISGASLASASAEDKALIENQSRGDLYHACKTASGFEMEGSGSCPVHAFTSNGTQGFQQTGEFFEERAGDGDHEGAMGALAMLKGSDKMIMTILDPHPTNDVGRFYWTSQGVNWVDPVNGDIEQYYTLYASNSIDKFGKASGIGDVEILTAPAPIEIGNRVWLDTNGDGVQDAGEAGIAGITVQLLDSAGTTVIATVITDAAGNYIFSSDASGADSASHKYNINNLTPNTAYKVRIPNVNGGTKQAALGGNALTTANTGSGANTDINDSDGAANGNDADVAVLASNIAFSGVNNHTFDFGFSLPTPTVSLGSLVWEDVDQDGLQGAAEPRILGAKVNLLVNNGSGTFIQAKDISGVDVAEFTTQADGQYLFTNLPEGQYKVTVDVPANYKATPLQNVSGNADTGGEDDSNIDTALQVGTVHTSSALTLAAGTEPTETTGAGSFDGDDQDDSLVDANGNMTVDFGFIKVGSWSGNVSKDTNNDDVGEVNLNNVEIKLYRDINGDGMPDGGAIATTTTGTDGNYSFTDLVPGDYVAVETQPAGLLNVIENEGGADNDQNGATPINAISGTVDAGENDANNDFVEEEAGSWSGNVSKDTNNDDNGDENLKDVIIQLFSDPNGDGDPSDGILVGTTQTGSNGNYFFTNLQPGDYIAVETQPAGLDDVKENEGGADDDKPNNNTINSIAGTVDAGETDVNNDFVEEEPLGAWSGNVSKDNNDDDVGDENLQSVEIQLFTDPNGDGDPSDGTLVGTTTTDTDGNYSFINLQPGDYVAVETQPAELSNVSENEGGLDNDKPDNNIINSIAGTVSAGETDVNNDFVEEDSSGPTVSIGSIIWSDSNNNGQQDASESGIAGAKVTLLNAIGTPVLGVAVQTTQADGLYYFGNLPAGDYRVQVEPPAGFARSGTQTTSNNDDAVNDSNIASSNGNLHTSGTFSLTVNGEPSGESANIASSDAADDTNDKSGNMTVDFGFTPSVKIGSLIWFEDDNDGIATNGVITYPPAGTVVTATATDGTTYTGATDGSGNYSIDVPINDEYIVRIASPAGYQPTLNSDDSEVPSDNSEDNQSHDGAGTKVVVGTADNTTVDFGFTASAAPPPGSQPIPTLSEWALILLMMMLGWIGYQQGLARKY